MSLKHAILVLLETEPSSGYDLLRQFKESLGYFWNASHQQLYQQLKRMTGEGWLSYQVETQSDRPDRKVYRVTESGRQALRTWLREPARPNRINDALLVKLFAGQQRDYPALAEEIRRHRAIHQHTLDKLRVIEARFQAMPPQQRRQLRLPFLTLRRGLLGEEAWLAWADEALAALESD